MTNDQLNDLYRRIADELDISDAHFKRAETSYNALGEYIGNHSNYPIEVYTQGSFRLGTVIRPLSDEDEYDLDLICEIANGQSLTAAAIKTGIGKIFRESDRYSAKLEEKKRCWRIEYADEAQFHMDITPAKPNVEMEPSILVTNKSDNGSYSFSPSNPRGYADWFDQRKLIASVAKSAVFESAAASVEPVKPNRVKLPLQRAIQILKRHRDKMFETDPDVKPISIIITTLAAQAYCGELGVYDAVKGILETLPQYIQRNSNGYRVPNPSNPAENFADKWNSEPRKAKAFFDWIAQARNDLVVTVLSIGDDYTVIEDTLGAGVVGRALVGINQVRHDSQLALTAYSNPSIRTALSVPHRQRPLFRVPKAIMLGIQATVSQNGQQYTYKNNSQPIPKHCSIDFSLIVSPAILKGGYTVWWQVVNTGDEARAQNGLRGGFEKKVNTTQHHETSLYAGTHYVQAFLTKRGSCIAKSSEFIVNIL